MISLVPSIYSVSHRSEFEMDYSYLFRIKSRSARDTGRCSKEEKKKRHLATYNLHEKTRDSGSVPSPIRLQLMILLHIQKHFCCFLQAV